MLDQNVGGQLINIGTGKDISIAEFAKLMARIVGFKGEIVFDTSKPDGTPRKLLDVTRANSLGWKHQIELEDGLSRTYDWFVSALRNGEIRGY
jgi:GDP-L-fucose synthase